MRGPLSAGDFSCFFHCRNFPTEPLILWNELLMAVGGNGHFDPMDFHGGGLVPQWFQWPVVPYWTSSIGDNHYWLDLRRPISRIFLRLHQVRQRGLQHVSFHNCCNTSSSILLSRSQWECCQYFCAVLICALPCFWPPACLVYYFCRKKITRLKRAKTIRCYLSVICYLDIYVDESPIR